MFGAVQIDLSPENHFPNRSGPVYFPVRTQPIFLTNTASAAPSPLLSVSLAQSARDSGARNRQSLTDKVAILQSRKLCSAHVFVYVVVVGDDAFAVRSALSPLQHALAARKHSACRRRRRTTGNIPRSCILRRLPRSAQWDVCASAENSCWCSNAACICASP